MNRNELFVKISLMIDVFFSRNADRLHFDMRFDKIIDDFRQILRNSRAAANLLNEKTKKTVSEKCEKTFLIVE